MTLKHLIGLVLIVLSIPVVCAVTTASRRAREWAFFLMLAGWVVTDRMDIHFFSYDLYRGSTRGVEISMLDLLGLGVLAGHLLNPPPGAKRWFWPASLGFMLLFLVYSCFSVAISTPRLFGVFELSKMLRGIMVFLLAAWFVRSERELGLLVLALAAAVAFEGALALKERFIGGVDRVTGTLVHPNSLSMYLCLTVPVFVAATTARFPALVRYAAGIAIGVAAVAELLTFSRAGVPIFAFVVLGAGAFCASLRLTFKKVAVVMLAMIGVLLLMFKYWSDLRERYNEATFQQEIAADQFENRGQYFHIASAILRERFFGVGLNNWSYWVSKKYARQLGINAYQDYDDIPAYILESNAEWRDTYAPPAHDLGVITAGELGLPGLAIFALLWARWFQMGFVFLWKRSPDPMLRMGAGFFFATCGIFLQSVTEWVFRATPMFMTFHILMGALAGLYYQRKKARASAHAIPARLDERQIEAGWRQREPAPAYGRGC
jgi:hypothetical protein